MPLSDDLIDSIRTEIESGIHPQDAFPDIPTNEREDFWNWFRENGEEFNANHDVSFDPDTSILSGRCFGNSQTITYLDGPDYYEGFAKIKNQMIYHGFNAEGNIIKDFTVLNNKETFRDEDNPLLPNHYIGVRIPLDFLVDQRKQQIEAQYMNIDPVLFDYYVYSKTPTDTAENVST